MKPISYSDAGVDIDAATRATDRIKELARRTFNERTLSEIGSFGGMFDGAFPNMAQPVLVASADGVVAWKRQTPEDDPVLAIVGERRRPERAEPHIGERHHDAPDVATACPPAAMGAVQTESSVPSEALKWVSSV